MGWRSRVQQNWIPQPFYGSHCPIFSLSAGCFLCLEQIVCSLWIHNKYLYEKVFPEKAGNQTKKLSNYYWLGNRLLEDNFELPFTFAILKRSCFSFIEKVTEQSATKLSKIRTSQKISHIYTKKAKRSDRNYKDNRLGTTFFSEKEPSSFLYKNIMRVRCTSIRSDCHDKS